MFNNIYRLLSYEEKFVLDHVNPEVIEVRQHGKWIPKGNYPFYDSGYYRIAYDWMPVTTFCGEYKFYRGNAELNLKEADKVVWKLNGVEYEWEKGRGYLVNVETGDTVPGCAAQLGEYPMPVRAK